VPETGQTNQASGPLSITPSRNRSAATETYESEFLPPAEPGTNVDDVNLNFTRAPLPMVLNYMSDAAGFIIIQQTRISSSVTVTVKGKHLTRDESYNLLNSVLNQSGFAAIRNGRTLTIWTRTTPRRWIFR